MKQIESNKIYIILMLCSLIGFSCFGNRYIKDKNLINYYQSYFQSKSYSIWNDVLSIDDKEFVVAASYIDKEKGIIDKAVVVEKDGGRLIPHLFFEKYKILNRNRKAIVDLSRNPLKYYGWRIVYSIPKDKKYSKGFYADYVSDNGRRITDGPTIEWDKKTQLFRERVFDTSE